MNRDQIEKLADDTLFLYGEFKENDNDYINVEELSFLMGFDIIFMPLVEKGLLVLLSKENNNNDNNVASIGFIAVDERLNLKDYREVISDLLMQYIIEDFEYEKKQYRIVTEVGSAEYLELVLPKEKFLEKHLELCNKNASILDNVIFDLSNYFNVSRDAIIRRYESLEMMPMKENELDQKNEAVTRTLKMN